MVYGYLSELQLNFFECIKTVSISIESIGTFNPIQDGPFRNCSRIEGAAEGGGGAQKDPLPKTCHTYRTMMKLDTAIPYLKKIQKIYKSRDTALEFC